MELEELIENTLRRKHLEEMMDRLEKEYTALEGMDNEQIRTEFYDLLANPDESRSKLMSKALN